MRDREAALRNRELELEEKEHSLNRKEHRLALMERAVRDKMVLAEVRHLHICMNNYHIFCFVRMFTNGLDMIFMQVYLKRSRECRPTSGGQFRQARTQEWNDLDESFSADAGDTSIMPTSALLDPMQIPKPTKFKTTPETSSSFQDRHVHFDDQAAGHAASLVESKPNILKVAEAIRGNKAKLESEQRPRTQQKVLHLPGYTGPAITVPVLENSDFPLDLNDIPPPEKPQQCSPVKLTVLYDDREELQRASNRLNALNLESNHHFKPDSYHAKFQNNASSTLPPHLFKKDLLVNNFFDRNIAISVDSLLDTNVSASTQRLSSGKQVSFASEMALRKNAFGGSTRRRRKPNGRSSTLLSSGSRPSAQNSKENVENAKNNALVFYQKDKGKSDAVLSRNNQVTVEKGKENFPNTDISSVARNPVATSLLTLPSAAAAVASAVVTRSKKSHVSFLR